MVNLLLFDLDGTLIDSLTDITTAIQTLQTRRGLPLLSSEEIKPHVGLGLKTLLAKYDEPLTYSHQKPLLGMADEFVNEYAKVHTDTTGLYPGVLDYLSTCDIPKAIVTNKPIKLTIEIMNKLGLTQFDWVDVIGGDSLAHAKPHPIGIETVMRKLGVTPSETVMIGDGIIDIRAAKAANTWSIAVDFGYSELDELLEFGADYVMSSFDELPDIIEQITEANFS